MEENRFPDVSGCRIELVAPSSPVPLDRMAQGVEWLRNLGFAVRVSPQVTEADGYLAGSDEARQQELVRALQDPNNRIVWAARGGYGMGRVLARGLPVSLPPSPPWVIGFSDISLLLLHLAQRGWPCIHGPNITTLPEIALEDAQALWELIFRGTQSSFADLTCLNPGVAEGRIAPINWTVLCSVTGTRIAPELDGRILLLEDVHESAYRLDRHLLQISQTEWFPRLAGLVIGDLGGAERDPRLLRSIEQASREAGIPCAMGAPVGHGRRLAPLRVGSQMILNASEGWLRPEG